MGPCYSLLSHPSRRLVNTTIIPIGTTTCLGYMRCIRDRRQSGAGAKSRFLPTFVYDEINGGRFLHSLLLGNMGLGIVGRVDPPRCFSRVYASLQQ